MAGTIFGLPLSQRVDLNGKPSVGWLLYLYQANTSTPVNSYQDTALTVLNPWPVAADANGMMRQFWLADGSYRTRATNADGSITYFDQPSVLALGPSAGAAPSGGVDPNAIWQTGDVMWRDTTGSRSGWVRDNGRTIGNGTSGASERAQADCQPLFEFLWNGFPDSICPVPGGRGASAVSDFNASKQITLPDKRGYIPGGLDDMGNAAAGRLAGVPIILGGVTTAGGLIGETLHANTLAEMAAHDHDAFIDEVAHDHQTTSSGATLWTQGANSPVSGGVIGMTPLTNPSTGTKLTGVKVKSSAGGAIDNKTGSRGSGTSHNNVPRTVLGTFYRKL